MKRFQIIYIPTHLGTTTKTLFVSAPSKREAMAMAKRLSRVRVIKQITQFQ